MSPKAFICHRCFVQLDKSVQNKLHKCMKKKLLARMYMCGPGNGFGTFDHGDLDLLPNDPQINRIHLLPMMDVWTKFEEGRSRRSPVIDRKRKGYRRMDLQTDRPTCAKQYALSSSKGGHNNC